MIKTEKENVFYHSKGSFVTYMGDLYRTAFIPKGSSSGSRYIIITKKSFWVMSDLHINDISFSQVSGI